MMRAETNSHRVKFAPISALFTLAPALLLLAPSGAAQAQDVKPSEVRQAQESYQTFYLHDVTGQEKGIEITSALRNMLPMARVVYVTSERAICVRGDTQDIGTAQKLLSELDRPQRTWRLVYTITQIENGQRMGTQRVSMVAVSGERSFVKQGNRMPLVTGSTSGPNAATNDQVQYIDVGLNIEAQVEGPQDALQLQTKVEQSGLAQEKSGMGAQDPVIQQTTLGGTVNLTPGQPVVLGSLGIPGTTRQEEIGVEAEIVH